MCLAVGGVISRCAAQYLQPVSGTGCGQCAGLKQREAIASARPLLQTPGRAKGCLTFLTLKRHDAMRNSSRLSLALFARFVCCVGRGSALSILPDPARLHCADNRPRLTPGRILCVRARCSHVFVVLGHRSVPFAAAAKLSCVHEHDK